MTGLSGHVLLTPLPSNRVNGREGQAGLKAGSAAARALPVFSPSTAHGSPRDRKGTVLH